jgi:hypothetical protein
MCVGTGRLQDFMTRVSLKWTADTDVPTARPRIFPALEAFQIASLEPRDAHMIVQPEIGSVCPLWPCQRGEHPPISRNAGVFQVRPAAIREWLKEDPKSIDHYIWMTFFWHRGDGQPAIPP